MAQALGALFLPGFAGTTTLFGVTLTTAAGGLTLAGSLFNLGVGLAISAATRPDLPAPPRPDNIQVNTKNAAEPRRGLYGRGKVGGNVVFHRAKNGVSYRVIVLGHGETDAVEQWFLNNEPVSLNGSGEVTDDQYQYASASRVQILARLGVVPETAYSEITTVWPEWTSAHRLDGLWTGLVICQSVPPEKYRAMYPNGEPTLMALARGRKVVDPRSGTTAWSENAALIIADYIASPDGLNRPDALEDVSAEADISDEAIALAEGGTEARWRLSGTYQLTERPQDVLARMLAACAGSLRLKPSGKVALRVGKWREPEFVLTYDMIAEIEELDAGPDKLAAYNELPARFVSHDLGYVEVDAEPWVDAARQAAAGEAMQGQALSLLMSPSHRQARSVMKVVTDRDNPPLRMTLTCKAKALPAIYEDVIQVTVPELGIDAPFRVNRHQLVFEGANLSAVTLTLHQVTEAAYSLALDEQGAVQSLPPPDTSSGVPVPQNVVASASGVQVAANTFAAGIGVAWSPAPSVALSTRVQWSPTGADQWTDVVVATGSTNAAITGLTDGAGYDISVSFVTPGGVEGTATIETNVIAAAVTDAPDPPTSLVVTDAGGGQASITLTEASSPGLWKTEIYRDAVLVATIYADGEPGSSLGPIIDACGAGTFDWTARSVNVSNINSATDAGPFNQTIA